MKLTFLLLLALGVLVFGFISYFVLMETQLRLSDLEEKMGVLQEDPKFTRDEDDTYNTSMRLKIKGLETPLSIPGDLLRKDEERMKRLRTGDTIHYYQKIGSTSSSIRRIYGLAQEDKVFFTPEDSLKHYKSTKIYLTGALFFVLALLCLFFAIRLATRMV